MREIKIPMPKDGEATELVRMIDGAIVGSGLIVAMRNTLKKYPGSVHWQIKNGNKAGTLELTFWPKEGRAWFTTHEGRKAEWIDEKMQEVEDVLRKRLQGRGDR